MQPSGSNAATTASTSPDASAVLVLADNVCLVQVRVGRKQRRANCVTAGQRPAAEVRSQLDDAGVLVTIGREGKR
jgi:hypothetical protein